MTPYEYSGRVLYLNMTDGSSRIDPLDPTLAADLLGGWGIAHKLAYDLIIPGIDAYSPQNVIIMSTGPFNGTIVPGSSRICVTYKSPLTGGIVTNNGGGNLAVMLKSCGYDYVVLQGKSDKPVYVLISDDNVKLMDASELWHKTDTWDTCDLLRKKYEPCSIVAIGPAGEQLVRFSLTFVDKGGGSIGNGGLPAVMGSKNLKALVVCQGTRSVHVAHPSKLFKKVDTIMREMMTYRFRPTLIQGGTYSMAGQWTSQVGHLHDNYTQVELNYGHSTKDMNKIHIGTRKTIACPSCPMGDKELNRLSEGDYAPMTAYMTDFLEHPNYQGKDVIQDHNRAVYYYDLANRLGIDDFNFKNVLTLMSHLFKRGIITKSDTDGIEIDENNFETKIRLLKMVANREGFGGIMAEGALLAARKIGRDTEKLVCHIKGAVPWEPVDPRRNSVGTMEFCQIETPGRPFYVPGGIGVYMGGRPLEEHIHHLHRIGVPESVIPRLISENTYLHGRVSKWGEDWYSIFNSLGQCHRLYVHRFYGLQDFVELYSAVTGKEIDGMGMRKMGERAWNLYKILNVREGFTRIDDRPPDTWFVPLKGNDGQEYKLKDYFGLKELTREDFETMLDDYYDERGWDIKTSIPTKNKIIELGLDRFISANDFTCHKVDLS